MLCQKIISGGQTGVDRGALDAAIFLGMPCGGWCPEGRMAEDGAISKKYPLKEIKGGYYDDRTKKNAEEADGTLIIYDHTLAGGTLFTHEVSIQTGKPVFLLKTEGGCTNIQYGKIKKWLYTHHIKALNVAGPRESEWEGAYKCSKLIISGLISFLNNNLIK